MHLRILDLDGSVTVQATLPDVAEWSSVATVALRALAARLRLWSRAATMRRARERLSAQIPVNGATLTLIGSGDFHQRSADDAALARNEAVNRELLRTLQEACAC